MTDNILNQLSMLLEPVSILVALSAVILLVTLLVNRRSHGKIKQLERELRQARNDLRALTTSSLGVGSRLLEVERGQRKLAIKAEKKAPVVELYESANQPYDHAKHLAQQGKEIDEISSLCGISKNEAELIKMMNRLEEAS
ncbi:MAG: DUF2802 domain-containing protein [Thioalkalispiraceae bacterium]|jgi:hypothetical protein